MKNYFIWFVVITLAVVVGGSIALWIAGRRRKAKEENLEHAWENRPNIGFGSGVGLPSPVTA